MPFTRMSHAERGFSLVEMMAAMVVTGLALTVAGQFFVASRNSLSDEVVRQETLQGLRAALDTLERDLRLVGACLPMTGGDFPPLSGTNGSTFDAITTRTAAARSDLTCIQSTIQATGSAAGTAAHATTLPLLKVDGFAVGQRGYIRGSNNSGEYFTITDVNASTNRLQIAAGLQNAYLNGSGVWAIDEHVYAIDALTYAPMNVLTLAINGGAAFPFAFGVQAVKIQYELASHCPPCDVVDMPTTAQWILVNQLYVTVTLRSSGPLSSGQYYTVTGTIGAKPRNFLPGSQVL